MKSKLLRLAGLISSLTPLGIYAGINWEQFAPTTVETVKLGIGGAIVLFLGFKLALKKMNLPKGLFGAMMVLALLWLFQAIITDLLNIWMWYTAGLATDVMVFEPLAEQAEETAKIRKQAKITAQTTIEVQRQAGVGGRV